MSDNKLYRYIPFETLVQIVQSKSLHFSEPLHDWDDEYEGYLYRAYQSYKQNRITDTYFREYEKDFDQIISTMECIRAMSWCKSRDNLAMWYAYAYENKSVMIEIDREYLEDLYYESYDSRNMNSRRCSIRVFDVDYVDEISIAEELKVLKDNNNELKNTIDICKLFIRKRNDFKYEEEVRSIIIRTKDDKEHGFDSCVSIENPSEFITDVLIHPKAKSYYVDIVKKYCSNNDIKCSGKSDKLKYKE